MKKFLIILIAILCFSLCACKSDQLQNSIPDNHTESENPSQNEEITLPSHWGSIDLPDIPLDDPT